MAVNRGIGNRTGTPPSSAMNSACSATASTSSVLLSSAPNWSLPAPARKPFRSSSEAQSSIRRLALGQPISKRWAVSIASATPKPSESTCRRRPAVAFQSIQCSISWGEPGFLIEWPTSP